MLHGQHVWQRDPTALVARTEAARWFDKALEIDPNLGSALVARIVTVYDYQRGLRYRTGRFSGLVDAGPHGGDLPNVTVSANGVLSTIVTVPGASLGGPGATLADSDGAALVLHAAADDNLTDPSGNSGARIACAILVPASAAP